MTGVKPRPQRLFLPPKEAGASVQMTLDDMELVRYQNTPLGEWSRRVLAIEQEKILNELGIDKYLPRGAADASVDVETDGLLVSGLVSSSGQVWSPGRAWHYPDDPVDVVDTVPLDEDEVAFVARAFWEGADAVLFRSMLPLAVIGAGEVEPSEGLPEPPQGGVIVAIVDGLDRNAVLELVSIVPGPQVFRLHDGKWHEDPAWVQIMRSIKPPAMVKLSEGQVPTVVQQVNQATAGEPFEPFDSKDKEKYVVASITESPYLSKLYRETTEAVIMTKVALAATAGRNITPKDRKNTEKLRRYWLYGKGAAKIRWGTPGAWRRCYRNVVKHMGPKMAPGYCTNLSKRLGGPGVATHVGSKKK